MRDTYYFDILFHIKIEKSCISYVIENHQKYGWDE